MNAIFNCRLLSIVAYSLVFIYMLKGSIIQLGSVLDLYLFCEPKAFFQSELFSLSFSFLLGIFGLMFLFWADLHSMRTDWFLTNAFHFRFPKFRERLTILLVMLNLSFLHAVICDKQTIPNLVFVGSYLADTLGFCELAEKLCSTQKYSFYAYKWQGSSRRCAEVDIDPKFDQIISSVHGSRSNFMAERHLQLSKYYQSKKSYTSALSELKSAQSIYETKPDYRLVDVLLDMAVIHKKLGDFDEAKVLMRRSVSMLHFSSRYLDVSIEQLAKELKDIETLNELSVLEKSFKSPQRMTRSIQPISVRTIPFLSAFLAVFLNFWLFFPYLYKYSLRSIPRRIKELEIASPEKQLELLQDIITIEFFFRQYDAVELHSKRFLELCQERN